MALDNWDDLRFVRSINVQAKLHIQWLGDNFI